MADTIEQRLAKHEQVLVRILATLETHTAMMEAIHEAVRPTPGPSPVGEALAAVIAKLDELPDRIGQVIREELVFEADDADTAG